MWRCTKPSRLTDTGPPKTYRKLLAELAVRAKDTTGCSQSIQDTDETIEIVTTLTTLNHESRGNMDIKVASFRWGLEHLGDENPEWIKLKEVLKSFTREDIENAKLSDLKEWMAGLKKSPRVGGQPLINSLIDGKFQELSWIPQVHVLPKEFRDAYWTMDFQKQDIGIEVSFNNAGALAQNLLRLSVMSESNFRAKEEQIRLGILITATEKLKKWSNMDSSVITYETVNRIMPLINMNIPTPIVLVGLDAATDGVDWEESKYFGHKTLSPFNSLSESEKLKWHKLIEG